MTDKTRNRVEMAALAIVFGAGSGWAGFNWRLTELSERVAQTGAKVDRIDQRVAEMYCATLPTEKRPGCR